MDLINTLPPLVLVFIGCLLGALLMRLANGKDKTTIAKLITDIAVLSEKLTQFQDKDSQFKQLQQHYLYETFLKDQNLLFSIKRYRRNPLNSVIPELPAENLPIFFL